MSREALELAKFSKFDTLGEILCLNNSAWGLKDAETRLTFNLHVVEHMLQWRMFTMVFRILKRLRTWT